MAVIKGVNSYRTVGEADEYFENRLDAEAWFSASADEKSKALVTACSIIDRLYWSGTKEDYLQTLAFPRMGIYHTIAGFPIPIEDIPDSVMDAQCVQAVYLLANPGILNAGDTVDDIEVEGVKLKGLKRSARLSPEVMPLVRDLLTSNKKNWWRAN
jgi:hypothetical protein